jgi:hypothetical protein
VEGSVQHWIELKETVATAAGLERTTLRVLASVPLHAVCALVLRRPLTSRWPWLALLAGLVGNEASSLYADRVLEDWELEASVRDVLLAMALPTFLLFVGRVAALFPPRIVRPRTISLPPPPAAGRETIIDAEFEEVG